MNNNEFYDRRDDRALTSEQNPPQPPPEESVAALAVHRDPSIPDAAPRSEPKAVRGVAWVRPSELPTMVGTKWAGRGIDLQSDLVRRARRVPITAARAGRRTSRSAIARPESASPTATASEELGL
ncbi:MAG TPA: hypothetical protein VI248_24900 [Kineosporiaceae bacterium]